MKIRPIRSTTNIRPDPSFAETKATGEVNPSAISFSSILSPGGTCGGRTHPGRAPMRNSKTVPVDPTCRIRPNFLELERLPDLVDIRTLPRRGVGRFYADV
jgi:hypothetical protein